MFVSKTLKKMFTTLFRRTRAPQLATPFNHHHLHNRPTFGQSNRNPLVKSTPQIGPCPQNRFLSTVSDQAPTRSRTYTSENRRRTAREPQDLLPIFTSYGMAETTFDTILKKLPKLVYCHPEKDLKPKLEFLRSSGFSGDKLADVLVGNPRILLRSLSKEMVPSLNAIKEIVSASAIDIVGDVLKNPHSSSLTTDHVANVDVLRRHGLSDPDIRKLLVSCPKVLTTESGWLDRIVGKMKDAGAELGGAAFFKGVEFFSSVPEEKLTRKVEVYGSIGWSEDEVFAVLLKQPVCLYISEDKIRRRMEFFREVLGWDASVLSKNPALLMFNVESRFKKRLAVLNILVSKGLIRENVGPFRFMMGEKLFYDKFVKMYEKTVPELLEVYEPKLAVEGS